MVHVVRHCGLFCAIVGGALMAAMATAAMAQPGLIDNRDMGVSANTPDVCIISNQNNGRIRPLVNATTSGAAGVQITSLIDIGTMSTAAAQVEVSFDAMCNFPHKLNVISDNNGLFRPINAAPAVDGFASAVPYTADVSWGGQTLAFEANAQRRGLAQADLLIAEPVAGLIVLQFNVLPGATNSRNGAPLAAGIYSDIIRLSVEPQ
jgi:hypothetical protein